MRSSLRAKLFLTLLLTGIVMVVGTHAFVHWSFQRGLEEMAAERRQQRLERIGERLIAIYERDGGWQKLRADKRLWISTLFGRGGREQPPPPPPNQDQDPRRAPDRSLTRYPHRPGHQPRWLRQTPDAPGVWPPAHMLERANAIDDLGRPPPLELRLMLLDADGEHRLRTHGTAGHHQRALSSRARRPTHRQPGRPARRIHHRTRGPALPRTPTRASLAHRPRHGAAVGVDRGAAVGAVDAPSAGLSAHHAPARGR